MSVLDEDRTVQTQEALKRVQALGLTPCEPTKYDAHVGRIAVRGDRTGFLYEFTLDKLEAIKDLPLWIGSREEVLVSIGFLDTPGPWYHDSDRDNDGDSYQYDHYAVHRQTGERKYLDVGYSISDLTHDEFRLHVATNFPRRAEVCGGGPIRNGRLEAHVFRHCPQ